MDQLTEEQLAEFKEAFSLFDKDRDDVISQEELGALLRSLGCTPTQPELQKMIKEADTNENDTVTLQGFLQVMACRVLKDTDGPVEVGEALRMLDKDGSGYISAAQIRLIITNLFTVTEELLDEVIREARTDGHGLVNYEGAYNTDSILTH